jgi:hypothetical protein
VFTRAHIWSQVNPVCIFPFYFVRCVLLLSFYLCLVLPSSLFYAGFPTKTLYAFLFFPMCDMFHASYISLLIALITFVDRPNNICQEVQIIKLLIMQFSPASCYSFHLRYRFILSILFSNTVSLCSSHSVRDQVACP